MPQGPALLRLAVDIANKATKALHFQALVTYERNLGNTGYGDPSYASPVQLHAIVDYVSRQVRTQDGTLTVSRASITLLDINEVIAATGGNGIDNNDKFTLPDGDTGPLLDIRGFVDAGTTHPIATEVIIG